MAFPAFAGTYFGDGIVVHFLNVAVEVSKGGCGCRGTAGSDSVVLDRMLFLWTMVEVTDIEPGGKTFARMIYVYLLTADFFFPFEP